jgi:hypothetical protein
LVGFGDGVLVGFGDGVLVGVGEGVLVGVGVGVLVGVGVGVLVGDGVMVSVIVGDGKDVSVTMGGVILLWPEELICLLLMGLCIPGRSAIALARYVTSRVPVDKTSSNKASTPIIILVRDNPGPLSI